MRKIGLIAFLITLTIGSILAANIGFGSFNINLRGVKGSGISKTEIRDISDFEAIKASGAVNIEVSVQKDFSVEIEADDNLLEHIKTEMSGDTLKIYSEGRISPKSRINVKISMPEINNLNVSGASTAIVTNVKSGSLKLKANGASKIKIDGEAKNLEAQANGASDIRAENLKVEYAVVDANGASDTTVSVNVELRAEASGASTIRYTGDPQNIIERSSGASSVKRR